MRSVVVEDAQVASDTLLSLLKAHLPYSLHVLRCFQYCRFFEGGLTPTSHALFARFQNQSEAGGGEEARDGKKKDTSPEHFACAYVDLAKYPGEAQGWIYSTLEDLAFSFNSRPSSSSSASASAPSSRPTSSSSSAAAVATPTSSATATPSSSKGTDTRLVAPAGHAAAQAVADQLVLALLRRIRRIDEQHSQDPALAASPRRGPPGMVLLGSVTEVLRARILALKVRVMRSNNTTTQDGWDLYAKWLFWPEVVAASARNGIMTELPRGMQWGELRRGDVDRVRATTAVKRSEETLLRSPSTLVRLDDGTPIAWAFLMCDGSLITLYVEEKYRNQGIAKAVAYKLMRDHLKDFGDDGFGAVDVFVENRQSRAVSRSLGGKLAWLTSWLVVDLSTVGDPM